MHPQSEAIRQLLLDVTQGMEPTTLAQHPEGKWSTAQIVEHLSRTYTATARVMQKCVEAGQPIATRPTPYQRVAAFLVTGVGYFPGGRKAPSFAEPRGLGSGLVLPQMFAELARMEELISQCEARHGAVVPIADHFILGPLNASQWRKFHFLHARHHSRQISRLRGN
jgi:hypothetical protein